MHCTHDSPLTVLSSSPNVSSLYLLYPNIGSYPSSRRRIFMNTRTIALFSIGLAGVLFAASQTQAQPGKGSGKRAGADADIKKLEKDLEKLLEKVTETKAKIARVKEADKGKGGKD